MTQQLAAVLKDKNTWIFQLIGLLVIGVAFLTFKAAQPPEPPTPSPIVYRRVDYNKASVCAGQSVSYTVQVDIVGAPSVLTGVESWWSFDRGNTAIPGDKFTTAIYTEPVSVTRVTSITVPTRLTPGHYEYRRAAYTNNAPPSIYTVPFTVTGAGCK